jgi:RNA polymerase sigma-70 factor (ECF subfamily)
MLGLFEQQSLQFKQALAEARRRESSTATEAPVLAGTAVSEKEASPTSEEELVRLSRHGDVEAFGQLIQRHYNMCLKRALSMMRNRSDAEDEVQNTFWKAFHRLEQFRGEGSFAAWLSRIVENQCLMRIREARQSQFVYLDETTESNVRLELVGQTSSPEDQLGDHQVEDLLRREISRIPPLLRNVMLLRDVQQLPMSAVAEQLGLSVPAAKSRLMRARVELRSRLMKHCGRRGQGTLMQKARYNKSAYASAA